MRERLGASIPKAKLYRLDNPDLDEWGKQEEGWSELRVKSIEALRLEVKNTDLEKQYKDIKGVDLVTEQKLKKEFLKKNSEYAKDRERIEGYEKGLPKEVIDNYAEYYTSDFKGYADDRYLLAHPQFYREMVNQGIWKERDFSKVPTERVEKLYEKYQKLPEGLARIQFRRVNPTLNRWLIEAKGLKPLEAVIPAVPRQPTYRPPAPRQPAQTFPAQPIRTAQPTALQRIQQAQRTGVMPRRVTRTSRRTIASGLRRTGLLR